MYQKCWVKNGAPVMRLVKPRSTKRTPGGPTLGGKKKKGGKKDCLSIQKVFWPKKVWGTHTPIQKNI